MCRQLSNSPSPSLSYGAVSGVSTKAGVAEGETCEQRERFLEFGHLLLGKCVGLQGSRCQCPAAYLKVEPQMAGFCGVFHEVGAYHFGSQVARVVV